MHKIRISAIEKACQIGDLAYEYILKEIRVGMKELAADTVDLFDDLALRLERSGAVVDLHLVEYTDCARVRKQLMEAVGGPALVWEKKL